MLDVCRIKNRALKMFARGDSSKLDAEWRPRIIRILFLLDAATHAEDLSMLGARFRKLTGERAGTYAIEIRGSVYVTYQWSLEGHPVAVDLEDLK
jgi:plasmid maintenance system killer protein